MGSVISWGPSSKTSLSLSFLASKLAMPVVIERPYSLHLWQEKDMFEKYYKQHLAKRLLHGKTSSDDAGENFACLLGVSELALGAGFVVF